MSFSCCFCFFFVLSSCVLNWHGVLACLSCCFSFLYSLHLCLVHGFFFSMKDLSCLVVFLSFPFMSCHVMSFRFLSCPILFVMLCPVLFCDILHCLVRGSCLVLSCHVLSCPAPSRPVKSCLALSCLFLSCSFPYYPEISCPVLPFPYITFILCTSLYHTHNAVLSWENIYVLPPDRVHKLPSSSPHVPRITRLHSSPPPPPALTPRIGARPSVTPPNQVWVGGAQAPFRQLLLMRSNLFYNFFSLTN